jgi:hypothetical protein
MYDCSRCYVALRASFFCFHIELVALRSSDKCASVNNYDMSNANLPILSDFVNQSIIYPSSEFLSAPALLSA